MSGEPESLPCKKKKIQLILHFIKINEAYLHFKI